ncbi:hypothetical protein DPMN_077932 [Dreissena polymorpha]|uniref:Uncharacterized protein n=1 Tax=Dreissena polymorpha TaxID=45954 RepID=A0A9D3YQ70_DREPO|nr:hypothetical protein DPMN_077932 [Dreissena polymorpha]
MHYKVQLELGLDTRHRVCGMHLRQQGLDLQWLSLGLQYKAHWELGLGTRHRVCGLHLRQQGLSLQWLSWGPPLQSTIRVRTGYQALSLWHAPGAAGTGPSVA